MILSLEPLDPLVLPTPLIASVEGTFADGLSVLIRGIGFTPKDHGPPLVYANFEGGLQPSSLGLRGQWDQVQNMMWSPDGGYLGTGGAVAADGSGEWTLRVDYDSWTREGQRFYIFSREWRNFRVEWGTADQNWKPFRVWPPGFIGPGTNYPNLVIGENNGRVFTENIPGDNGFWAGDLTVEPGWHTRELAVRASSFGQNDGRLTLSYDNREYADGPIVTRGPGYEDYMTLNFVFHQVGANLGKWNPAWQTSNRVAVDQLYVDVGGFHRVLIADAPRLEAASKLAIQIPSAWDDGSIRVTAKPTEFPTGSQAWLYVFDRDGLHNTEGFPITVGGTPPPANVGPRISDVSDQVVTIDGGTGSLAFTVADAETPAGSLAVTATSSDPALVPPSGIVLGGSGADRTVAVTPTAGRTGSAVITLTVTDASGLTAVDTFSVTVGPVVPPVPPTVPPISPPVPPPMPPVSAAQPYAAGTGRGTTATATLFGPDGTSRFTVTPFGPLFAGGVRVVTADVTGDGVADLVAGAGPGGGPHVVVLDGATGAEVSSFFAFEPTFAGGVFVTAADLTGDGKAEVVVTPDEGGGPVVAVYDGAKMSAGLTGDAAQVVRFLGIDDQAFRGGARPALGDVNGDRTPDLVVSAGMLGGPRIAIFDGKNLTPGSGSPGRLAADFFAFESALRNGSFVAAGDMDGDGFADLAFGGGPGGAPRVRVFGGRQLLSAGPFATLDEVAGVARLADFFDGDPVLRGGVRLAVRDVEGDGRGDLVVGTGAGEPSRVRVYLAPTLLADPADPDRELDPFGFPVTGGVFVG